MEESITFYPLLIVIFLAFIVPILLSRFKMLRIPIVVGEIIAGIIVGGSVLGIVQQHDPVLDLLSEFGFVFLMFLSGMEVDFSAIGFGGGSSDGKFRLSNMGPLPLAVFTFILTLILSTGIGFGLQAMGMVRNPWMMALILSTTSLGVVVPVLKEKNLTSGRYGQTILLASLIADFVTMLLITVLVAVLSGGLTLEILLIGLLFVAFFLMYRFGDFIFNRIPRVRGLMDELSHATSQIKIRLAFTIMLSFVVLSEFLGTEIILGAFLAGAIISLLRQPDDAEVIHQMEAVGYGFFIPIFFIMVGVDFDLRAIISSPSALLLEPILLLSAILVKFVPTLLMRFSYSWRETLGAGALLSSRLSLIIAASAIGLRLGVISGPVNSDIILVAIITVTVAPLLFGQLVPDSKKEEPELVVVFGAGSLGTEVGRQLQNHNEKVVLIDFDERRAQKAQKFGLEVILGHVDQFDPITDPILNQAKSVICIYSDIEVNYRVCLFVHTYYGIDDIVARVSVPVEVNRFERLGVKTVNAAMDQATLLVMLARNPAVYELLTRTDDDKEVCEVIVHNPEYMNVPLREIEFPMEILVLAIRRDGELMVPHGSTKLIEGDHLTLLGTEECANITRSILSVGAPTMP